MRIRAWLVRQPLWLKLTAAAVGLTSAALTVVGVAVAAAVQGYLMGQVDQQVRQISGALSAAAQTPPAARTPPGSLGIRRPPAVPGLGDLSIEVLDANGRDVGSLARPGRRLDIQVTAGWIAAHLGKLVTVPVRGSGESWRMEFEPIGYRTRHLLFVYGADDYSLNIGKSAAPGLPGTLAVGVGLSGVSGPVGRLILVEVLAGAGLIVLVGVATALVARAGTRRLAVLGTFSARAGAVDTSYRFPDLGGGEAGRIAGVLNAMLSHVKETFAARAADEEAARAAAERLRERFASTVRDLHGPLSVIAGFAGYYHDRSRRAAVDFRRVMKRIDDEAARMASTLDELAVAAPVPEAGAQPGVAQGAGSLTPGRSGSGIRGGG